MKKIYFLLTLLSVTGLLLSSKANAQACTPYGNPAVYGTGTTWRGYLYQGTSFNTYKGYITEGNSSAAFDESFGGAQTNFATNGCPVYTDGFSVRFRLTKTFAAANYSITVGGDDGYRLSLDGGATWVINGWSDHSYGSTSYDVYLNGSYNMVLEYYENTGDNRISFSTAVICTGDGDPTDYGNHNTWKGYLYQGMNFDAYKGYTTKGNSSNPNFDDNFGGGSTPVTVATSNCSIQTQAFSARYRLRASSMTAGTYIITIGGDDGYRFSIDGGATWAINKWGDQSYNITSMTVFLSGNYNFVLEYYQNGGYSRVSFNMSLSALLPVKLSSFTAAFAGAEKVQLAWATEQTTGFSHFLVQRSTDGSNFKNIQSIKAQSGNSSQAQTYSVTDPQATAPTLYYRLAMVDIDGSVSYSTVIRLQNTSATSLRIYPTVVDNHQLYIESGKSLSNTKAVIYDMNGRQVSSVALQNTNAVQAMPINSNLKTGTYIVTITDGISLLGKQMIVVK